MGVCGSRGFSWGSANGGKLPGWPMCQEAEWGGGAFFPGGEVLLPTKPHGCSAAPTWLVWPWPHRPWGLSSSRWVPEGGHRHCVGAAASPQPPSQAARYQVMYKPAPCVPPWTSSSDLPQPPTSGPSSTGQCAHAGTGADGSLRVKSSDTLTRWLSLLGSRTGVQTLRGSSACLQSLLMHRS